jgi:outer membrane protein TolC
MPWPGVRGHAKRAGLADARAVSATAADAHWNRLALAWRAYAAAYWAGRRAEVARDETATMDRMAAAARARYESGRGRLEEILRVEASRVGVQADLAGFEAERAAALAELAAFRGRMSDSVEFDLEEPWGALAPDTSAVWGRVLTQHPRLEAIRERESAARSGEASARRMAWPMLVLRASYSTRSALEPMTGMPAEDMWGAGVGLELPIGVGGREGAMAREMSNMAEASAAERRAEELAIARDLTALRAQARAAARTKTLYADTLVVIERKALAAAWSAYEAGKIDLVSVFEAAHSLYTEQLQASRAGQSFADALARLLAASGSPELVGLKPGTWSPRFAKEDAR